MPEDLISHNALFVEIGIVRRWREALYAEAQKIAVESSSTLRGSVYITKEHFTAAAERLWPSATDDTSKSRQTVNAE